MTAHIHHLTTTTQAEHSEHISTLIEAPEKNIDELQSKLEPWNSDYFEDDKDIIDLDVGSTQKGIPRIQREKAQMGGLGILEHKARVVVRSPIYSGLIWADVRRRNITQTRRKGSISWYKPNGPRGDYSGEVGAYL